MYLASELKRGDTILTRTDEAGKIYFDKEEAHNGRSLGWQLERNVRNGKTENTFRLSVVWLCNG